MQEWVENTDQSTVIRRIEMARTKQTETTTEGRLAALERVVARLVEEYEGRHGIPLMRDDEPQDESEQS